MPQPNRHSRLEAYKRTHQAWIDQAVLIVSNVHPDQLPDTVARALAAAHAAGQAQTTPPTPVDWRQRLHDRYVRPCHAIMVAAGQTVREPDPPPTTPAPARRIIRRRP